jgi:vacuolar-type H+-ATPase subunit I/STV1
LGEENPKWESFMKIFESDMTKYIEDEDGPARIVEQMEKKAPKVEEKNTKIEELEKQIADLKAENDRLSGLDTEVSSTRHVDPKTPEPEIVKKTEELGLDLGLSKEQVKKMTERRKGVRQ